MDCEQRDGPIQKAKRELATLAEKTMIASACSTSSGLDRPFCLTLYEREKRVPTQRPGGSNGFL